MKILLDTASITSINEFINSKVIDGVTTNPSLVSKEEKQDYLTLLKNIAKCMPSGYKGHFSVEVISLDPKVMHDQAVSFYQEIKRIQPSVNFHIKIPVCKEYMNLISTLADKGIYVNATACFTAMQAKLAADAGASVVSFFFNRMKDYFEKFPFPAMTAHGEISNARRMIANNNVKIICGSIRNVYDIAECEKASADFVTVSPKILSDALFHSGTETSIKSFQEDIEKWLK